MEKLLSWLSGQFLVPRLVIAALLLMTPLNTMPLHARMDFRMIDLTPGESVLQVFRRAWPDHENVEGNQLKYVNIGSFYFFRIENKDYCASDKCLTIVVRACRSQTCQSVAVVAGQTINIGDTFRFDGVGKHLRGEYFVLDSLSGRSIVVLATMQGLAVY